MSTSPDDQTGPADSRIVRLTVPAVLLRDLHTFFDQRYCLLAPHPTIEGEYVAVPKQEMLDALANPTRYRVEYDATEFGSRPRLVDLEATVDLKPTRQFELDATLLLCLACSHAGSLHHLDSPGSIYVVCGLDCDCRTVHP